MKSLTEESEEQSTRSGNGLMLNRHTSDSSCFSYVFLFMLGWYQLLGNDLQTAQNKTLWHGIDKNMWKKTMKQKHLEDCNPMSLWQGSSMFAPPSRFLLDKATATKRLRTFSLEINRQELTSRKRSQNRHQFVQRANPPSLNVKEPGRQVQGRQGTQWSCGWRLRGGGGNASLLLLCRWNVLEMFYCIFVVYAGKWINWLSNIVNSLMT